MAGQMGQKVTKYGQPYQSRGTQKVQNGKEGNQWGEKTNWSESYDRPNGPKGHKIWSALPVKGYTKGTKWRGGEPLAILYLLCTLWLVRLTIFCDLLAHLACHSFHSSLCSHLIDFFLLTDFSFLTSFIMLSYFLTWSCYVLLCLSVAFLPSQQLVDLHFMSLVFFT